jgi:hypothetical protein
MPDRPATRPPTDRRITAQQEQAWRATWAVLLRKPTDEETPQRPKSAS